MSKIALVHCPHAIGWCYLKSTASATGKHDYGCSFDIGQGPCDCKPMFMRLPCPCNDKSTLLAEFDALDLIRKLAPDGSVERGMQSE